MGSTQYKHTLSLILLVLILSLFILNWISYGKFGKRGYINKQLHVVIFGLSSLLFLGNILGSGINFNKEFMNVSFYTSAFSNLIPLLIFMGAVLYTGIIEYRTADDLEKIVKDDMGQEVTQEKILYDTYQDYFTYKLLADIFLFIMFFFIVAFIVITSNMIPALSVYREHINHWGVYTGYIVFVILFFVFNSLREEILNKFLTDGFTILDKLIK